jgi:hypothetical protein
MGHHANIFIRRNSKMFADAFSGQRDGKFNLFVGQ